MSDHNRSNKPYTRDSKRAKQSDSDTKLDPKYNDIYSYKGNSNLVLPSNKSLSDVRKGKEEPDGEVQSLAGRLVGKMGDRVVLKKEDEKDQIKKKVKREKKTKAMKLEQELAAIKGISIADLETKDLVYQPKSDLTRAVYDLIVKFVRKQLNFARPDVINHSADEVIVTMKNPDLTEAMRREEIEGLLRIPGETLDDDSYNEICNLCKKINDWDSFDSKIKEDIGHEETDGIGVILSDDDDDSSDSMASEIRDSEPELDEDFFEKEENSMKKQEEFDENEFEWKQTNIVPKIDIPEPICKEGYKEYHIPAGESTTRGHLLDIAALPELVRKAFPKVRNLNLVQSIIFNKVFKSDHNLLVCAPTGAGKTNIAILSMLRVIQNSSERASPFKIIYIAPIKALVQEIVENLRNRLSEAFNIKVEEFTGDRQLNQQQISDTQIIVCTPEKWDIVTRKSLDRLYTKVVKLVIFDEIHLLHNDRGPTLEALVARIKRHEQLEGDPIRIVGLSATLPNYIDVWNFIAPERDRDDSFCVYFNKTYRPIPLKQEYIAMTNTKKAFRMINDIVYDKVMEKVAKGAQILIFVHSRPDTLKTAEYIKSKAYEEQEKLDKQNVFALIIPSESQKDYIKDAISDCENMHYKLRDILPFGLGIHHAGLSKEERACVEDLFRGRYIKVLVSTATLAWGVNLPARTVIIKGTQVYKDGKWTDLDSLDVTQMLGRAGRPGLDKEGQGIVITQQSQVAFYMSLMNEQLPVESKLIGRLADFINAECVIGNVQSRDDAIKWLSQTYLSSRMDSVLRNPNSRQYLPMYGLNQEDAMKNSPDSILAAHKYKLANIALKALDRRGLIDFDEKSGCLRSRELGKIASHYNCSSKTIQRFNEDIDEHTKDIQLFRIFSTADEFSEIYVRNGEEMDMQTLLNQVPFPIDSAKAKPGANKVNALLQVYIFRMNIESSDLISDMHFIRENAARLARAIHEIVVMKGYASVAELSLDLCRKIDNRMTSCHTPLRHFSQDLNADIISRLEKKNYLIDELRALEADKITDLLRCERKYGEKVYRLLKYLPKLKIEARFKPVSKSSLNIELVVTPDPRFRWKKDYHNSTELFWLFVEDVNQEKLLHHELLHMRKDNPSDKSETTFAEVYTSFYVEYINPVQPFYYIKIFSDRWFGSDQILALPIEEVTLPDECIISTQLLDLELKRPKDLEYPLFERKYEEKFKGVFNQIQTQAFKYLYLSDDDVVLLAAAGSGKTTCAEFAVIRNINNEGTNSKTGYIGANKQAAKCVYDNWKDLFGGYNVVLLIGNHKLDTKRIEGANIVIGDVESWYTLTSKTSKKRKSETFHLFIIDDIHLLHNDHYSTLEWSCSKLRYLTKLNIKEQGRPFTRIIALGSPISCAESIKSWLAFDRSKEPILLSYLPSIRPVKLDLDISEFYNYDYKMRLLSMQRPVYTYVDQYARDKKDNYSRGKPKPILIFVSDYHQAQEVSEMLIERSKKDKREFPRPVNVYNDSISESRLSRCLKGGVGYIYCGMNENDRQIVEESYKEARIYILVATVASCWSLKCRSHLTIIMDTQQHDGYDSVEYELTDILQMVGLTGRPLDDHECRCIIMCQKSKAEYYRRFLKEEPLHVESELPANLETYINYEIATGALDDYKKIHNPYLAHTFFYKRVVINPNYYGIDGVPDEANARAKVFISFFDKIVKESVKNLIHKKFIEIETDECLDAQYLSKISLEFQINQETLSSYNEYLSSCMIKGRMPNLIKMISERTVEFGSIFIRHGEIKHLEDLRFRLKSNVSVHKPTSKVELLILSQYSKMDVQGELIDDRRQIITTSYKLLRSILELAWFKDTYSWIEFTMELAKRLVPFNRAAPSIDMKITSSEKITDKRGNQVNQIQVTVTRSEDPYTFEEFSESKQPPSIYRDEGWYFLILGKPKGKKEYDKYLLFRSLESPPTRGINEYKYKFEIPDDANNYTYDLHFKSDFYRKVDMVEEFTINV